MAHALDAYAAEWERANASRQRGGREELARTRDEALHRFLAVGFPTTRDEEWRFTSVAPIADRVFTAARRVDADAARDDVSPFRIPGPSAAELVFVNGRYVPDLSRLGQLPPGTRVASLASSLVSGSDALEPYVARIATFERHPFVALSTAFLDDGACIQLPAGTMLEHPVHLLFVTAGVGGDWTMVHPRVLVVLGANSQASIVETYAGPAGARYFTNAVTEIALGENAVLEHYRLQCESAEAYHVGAVHVQAQRSATCAAHSISAGAALARNDVVAVLDGEGAECTLNGLYIADGQRLVDNHTTIDHARPHCGSREMYKGILAGRARGVFNGKIIVRPDAQKTDAKQTNRALLLSEDAQINTKPQLEIFANDVKCTHGAAVGQLDAEALFYLRSRGMSEAAGRQLLIQAFAADVLNRLPLDTVRTAIEGRLQQQLARAVPAAA
jgi:Fe-S cluster assembly protein SufD